MMRSSDPAIEAQRFYQFIQTCIVPTQREIWKPWSEFHKELVYTCCLKRAVVAAPRGSTKSTICSRYRPLYQLVTSPKASGGHRQDILLVSESSQLAKEHLEWIKEQVQHNPYIHAQYGNFFDPDLTWNEREAQLSNGHRVKSVGYWGRVRGQHPTSIYVDDLESLANMGTEEALHKLKAWFYRVLMGTLQTDEQSIMVVGTVVAQQSLLRELLDNPAWKGRTWKALMTDAEGREYSIWPQQWSLDFLKRKRLELKTHHFNAEFQNEPLGLEDQIIYEEWLRPYTPTAPYPTPLKRIYIMVDPAFTEERWGDYSAIVVGDETEDGALFIRNAWRKKVATPELRDTIVAFYTQESRKGVPIEIGIEEVAAQKGIRQLINEQHPNIPILSMRPDKDKARRLIDVSRYFEMGIVHTHDRQFEQEIVQFPRGSKDRVDALVYLLKRYEQLHPYAAVYTPAHNPIAHLDDTSLMWYAERAQAGYIASVLPAELVANQQRAEQLMYDLWEW